MAKKKTPKKATAKAVKKKAKKFTASIYCNSLTSDNAYYYYCNGNEGDLGYECGNVQRKVLKSKVHEPVAQGLCADGKQIYKITIK
jgi:hypothetical protein